MSNQELSQEEDRIASLAFAEEWLENTKKVEIVMTIQEIPLPSFLSDFKGFLKQKIEEYKGD